MKISKKLIISIVTFLFVFSGIFGFFFQVEAENDIEKLVSLRQEVRLLEMTVAGLMFDFYEVDKGDKYVNMLNELEIKIININLKIKRKIGEYAREKRNEVDSPAEAYFKIKEKLDATNSVKEMVTVLEKYGSRLAVEEVNSTLVLYPFPFVDLRCLVPDKEETIILRKIIEDDVVTLDFKTKNDFFEGEVVMIFEEDGWKLVRESWERGDSFFEI